MNSTITPDRKVGDLASENLGLTRVFQRHGIDFCCGGGQTLSAVCAKKGLDITALIAELDQELANASKDRAANLASWTIAELVDNIVKTHHAFLRTELPQVHMMAEKVARVHGDRHPELPQVYRGFVRMEQEMCQHMMKEESILFPLCVDLEKATEMPSMHCGSVAGPIRMMEMEHNEMAAFFDRARALTNNLTPPDDACMTYRALFQRLGELEQDLHLHTHKENNVLFPRAIAREEALMSAAQ